MEPASPKMGRLFGLTPLFGGFVLVVTAYLIGTCNRHAGVNKGAGYGHRRPDYSLQIQNWADRAL
jgi:hypothetical protein